LIRGSLIGRLGSSIFPFEKSNEMELGHIKDGLLIQVNELDRLVLLRALEYGIEAQKEV